MIPMSLNEAWNSMQAKRADGLKVCVAGYLAFPRVGRLIDALRGIGCDVSVLSCDFYEVQDGTGGAEWSRAKLKEAPGVIAVSEQQMDATVECSVFILAPPASRSLHMLAGVGCSLGRLVVLLDACGPELAYRMADDLCVSVEEVVAVCLDSVQAANAPVECGGLTA